MPQVRDHANIARAYEILGIGTKQQFNDIILMFKKIVFAFFSIILVSIFLGGYTFAKERTTLVIGNADCQSAPLDNPVNDVRGNAGRRLQQEKPGPGGGDGHLGLLKV